MSNFGNGVLAGCLVLHAIFYCYILVSAVRHERKMRKLLEQSQALKYF